MRIQVRDDKGKPLGAIQIKVIDLDAKEAAQQNNSSWQRYTEKLLLKIMKPQPAQPLKNKKRKRNSSTQVRTIEIKITMPTMPKWPGREKAWHSLRHTSRRNQAIGVVIILAAAIGAFTLFSGPDQPAKAANKTAKAPQLERGSPKYATILPAGKTITQLGGWARVSPPNRAPVYAYADRIGNTRIDVSEQPLPAKFIGDVDKQVAQLAQNFNANEKFNIDGTTAYVAKESDGSQSVILSKNNLLILITSGFPLSNNQWAAYINSLK